MAEKREINLPPAGHQRQEELKRRTDDLEAQAEAMPDVGAIDPAKLEPDREIQYHLDELAVSNKQPGYEYCWVYTGENMLHVRRKLSLRVPGVVGGWEIVQGDMKEATELKDVTGLRRLGDVVLMRCKVEFYEALMAYYQELALRQKYGVTENLVDMGRRYQKYMTVHTGNESPIMQRLLKQHAAQVAGKQFDQMVRNGTVPGVTPGTDARKR